MATDYATVHLATTSSTQDDARAAFEGGPVLVVADRQEHGRGRTGREWLSAPRALAASLAVAPAHPKHDWPKLTLVAGLAALDALPGHDIGLDWPNDLVIADVKVGGLIAEADDAAVVFGIGVNLWWPQAPEGMGAICAEDPGPDLALATAHAFVGSLLGRMSAGGDWGREEYLSKCVTVGGPVVWEGGTGVAVDVAPDGALVVQTDSGTIALASSEVSRIARGTVPPMRPHR